MDKHRIPREDGKSQVVWIQTTTTSIKRNEVIKMANKPLTVTCYLLHKGSENVKCTEIKKGEDYTPWNDIPEKDKAKQLKIMSERLSRSVSTYFHQHPEELINL